MRLRTGAGLEVYVHASAIDSIANYRKEAGRPMKRVAEVVLRNGSKWLVDGDAKTLWHEQWDELHAHP